jgi:hypothetical protein
MKRCVLVSVLTLCVVPDAWAQDPLQASVAQLRHAIGRWSVVTEFLNPDGSVDRSVTGTYEFAWVVPERVVRGESEIPELRQRAGLLFYVNERKQTIEMASVGADGQLFVMTGPLGGEVRQTTFTGPDGVETLLRFTRSNVAPASFESRMERSRDGGRTWSPGNRQVFKRS